jgi:hypothetical protein
MFIVSKTKNKTISWPVNVDIAADGGKIVKQTFTGTFKVLSDEEREALFPETPKLDIEDASEEGGEDVQATVAAVDWKEASVDGILKIMTGWAQVVDENKAPIEFNRDNLLAAARSPAGISILRGINTAIREIRTGAREKN